VQPAALAVMGRAWRKQLTTFNPAGCKSASYVVLTHALVSSVNLRAQPGGLSSHDLGTLSKHRL
jgi:hypothetical protein